MLGFVPQPNLRSLWFLALTELYWSINKIEPTTIAVLNAVGIKSLSTRLKQYSLKAFIR